MYIVKRSLSHETVYYGHPTYIFAKRFLEKDL